MTKNIDKRTGRPEGDHGTGDQAIDWIMNHASLDDRCECEVFLKAWLEGDTIEEWPDFYKWLALPAQAPQKFTIGEHTMERVFKPAGLTDLSNMQAVMDAVEKALSPATDHDEEQHS